MQAIKLLITPDIGGSAGTIHDREENGTKGGEFTAGIVFYSAKLTRLFVPFDDALGLSVQDRGVVSIEGLTKSFSHKFVSEKVEDWFGFAWTVFDEGINVDA